MITSESTAKLSEALSLAQSQFRSVELSGFNRAQSYKFASIVDYVRAARGVLAQHGLAVACSTDEITDLPPRRTKAGGDVYAVRVRVTARVMHSSGEWLEASAYGEGQDSGDKATYKAITGARKYALACVLGLAAGDDAEGDTHQPERDETAPATDQQRGELKRLAASEKLTPDARKYLAGKAADKAITERDAATIIERARKVETDGQ